MKTTDTALLDQWVVGRDAEAFHELVMRYSGQVYGTCLRILRNPAQAEELSQECFLALAENKIKHGESVGGWLHTVATRRALNLIKSNQRRQEREQQFAETGTQVIDASWDDIQGYVDGAIEELSPETREVIRLHFFDGETHGAIARELGLPRTTVTSRINKGVDDIRAQLKGRGISATAAVLGTGLTSMMSHAAPVSLSAGLAKLALAGTGGSTVVVGTGFGLGKIVLACLVVAVVVIGVVAQTNSPPVSIAESEPVAHSSALSSLENSESMEVPLEVDLGSDDPFGFKANISPKMKVLNGKTISIRIHRGGEQYRLVQGIFDLYGFRIAEESLPSDVTLLAMAVDQGDADVAKALKDIPRIWSGGDTYFYSWSLGEAITNSIQLFDASGGGLLNTQ